MPYDGVMTIRRFYLLHKKLDGRDETDICYQQQNLFALSHFTKTARNCLYHLWSGCCTQYMWNDDKYLLWQHIVQVYQDEIANGLKILPKLTHGHVYPAPFSVITAKYVVQKLSKTMLVALSTFETPKPTATAECCEMINLFFDCLNAGYLTGGRRKLKPFLEPYVNQNNIRFAWLIENALEYFNK